jgi:hypothetical protein
MRSLTNRNRRPVPGARTFDAYSGPAIVIAGTRAGTQWARGRNPVSHLIAPIDLDPGAVEWPFTDAHLCLYPADASRDFLTRLIQALLSDGVASVVVLSSPVSIHKREAI